tara:strand:+ start:700 stop:900 length:201 start_codon:yes stop_codon:yes gene_type:complete
MIKLEMNPREAAALAHALFLHTKDDSEFFASERVQVIRGILARLYKEIDLDFEQRQEALKNETVDT